MTTEVQPTPQELMAKIAAAGASGDLAEVIRLGNLLKKHQADIQKAEAEKLQKEAESLAGDRQVLAQSILKAVKGIGDIQVRLEKVKATGFTFKLPYTDANGVQVNGSVALSVPTIKAPAKRTGGGGGSTGVTVESMTGMSRSDLVDKYATADEKAKIAKASEDALAKGGAKLANSARWASQKPVVKRILSEHPELIRK